MMMEGKLGFLISSWGVDPDRTEILDEIAEFVEGLPGVAFSTHVEYGSEEAGVKRFKGVVEGEGLERVVVATVRPRLVKPTFERAFMEAGRNKYLVDYVDINELNKSAIGEELERTVEKLKILINASVARVSLLEPIGLTKVPVEKSVLVVGGGLAGVEASVRMADQGFKVHLVEKEPFLGGKAPQLGTVFPSKDCGTCITPFNCELHRRCFYRSPVVHHPNVTVHTQTQLKKLVGVVGNFRAYLETLPRYVKEDSCIACNRCVEVCPVEVPNEFDLGLSKRKAIYIPNNQSLPRVFCLDREACTGCGECVKACPVDAIDLEMKPMEEVVKVGSVMVTAGFDMFDPTGMFGYGDYPDVITQLKLARMLDMSGPMGGTPVRPSDGTAPGRVLMIQCVGSRDPRIHEYCSRICCGIAVKHAIDIKERFPDTEVTIVHKDIRLSGKDYEEYYYRMEELGVKLARGEAGEVTEVKSGLKLSMLDEFGGPLELEADLVVLSNGMEASEGNTELARILGVTVGEDGFLNERHPKLSSVETNIGGVFIAGACQGPRDIQHTMNEVLLACSKASQVLSKDVIEVELAKAEVDKDTCVGCGACASACPFDAIHWSSFGEPQVQVEACTGCGICAATCPVGAMQLRHFMDDQVVSAIEGLLTPGKWLKEGDEPVILGFACEGAAGYAAELAGVMGMKVPQNVRLVNVPCTGRIDALHLITAFRRGADGLVIFCCPEDQCHYIDGSHKALERAALMKKTLNVLGIGGDRLEIHEVNSCETDRYVKLVNEFAEKIGGMPPRR
jgi:heterodisulfide reductase subunit A